MGSVCKTIEANRYTFDVYENGTVVVRGEIKDQKAERNAKMQREADGTSRLKTDHGGHLVAAQQYGPAINENLSAQDSHLNQGAYRTMENAEMNVIRNTSNPSTIQTEKIAYMTDVTESGGRPEAYMINDSIIYANGQTHQVNLSFSNLTEQEQEEFSQMVIESDFEGYDNPDDTIRENMNTEEYTSLMEETDNLLPNIKDEFNMTVETYYSGLNSKDNSFYDDNNPAIADNSCDIGNSNDCSIGSIGDN